MPGAALDALFRAMIFCPASPVGVAEGGRPALLPGGWAETGAAAKQASSTAASPARRGSIGETERTHARPLHLAATGLRLECQLTPHACRSQSTRTICVPADVLVVARSIQLSRNVAMHVT